MKRQVTGTLREEMTLMKTNARRRSFWLELLVVVVVEIVTVVVNHLMTNLF